MKQATDIHCAGSGRQEGEDNSTHHLVPRAGGMTCVYCTRTQATIEAASN